MFSIITHWVRDLGLLVSRFFTHLTPEKYSYILLGIVMMGWFLLGGTNRR